MRGTILHYDTVSGLGHISGDDNNRYTFTRADINPASNPGPGMFVDFVARDGTATEIFAVPGGNPGVAAAAAPAAAMASAAMAAPVAATEAELGLFAYFVRAITSHYFRFAGRARRKEFWGFVLFAGIFSLIPLAIFFAGVADSDIEALISLLEAGVMDPGQLAQHVSPIAAWGIAATGVYSLLLLFPSMAVTVRRFHDRGISGWVYVAMLIVSVVTGNPSFKNGAIAFIPHLISLAVFIITVLNSKPGPNKWGPNPKGQ